MGTVSFLHRVTGTCVKFLKDRFMGTVSSYRVLWVPV